MSDKQIVDVLRAIARADAILDQMLLKGNLVTFDLLHEMQDAVDDIEIMVEMLCGREEAQCSAPHPHPLDIVFGLAA